MKDKAGTLISYKDSQNPNWARMINISISDIDELIKDVNHKHTETKFIWMLTCAVYPTVSRKKRL